MNKRWHACIKLVFVVAAVLARPTVSLAQIKVTTSGGFSAALQELVPEFGKTTGITGTTAAAVTEQH